MLFRTVYGPELEAIYTYVETCSQENLKVGLQQIYSMFLPTGQKFSTQPIDDALSFLVSAKLVHEDKDSFSATNNEQIPFALHILRSFRELENEEVSPQHSLDPTYSLILTEVFVRPSLVFVADLHSEVNNLRQVKELGGVSKEKIQAWKRVMEFLGVGHRVSGGFMCVYSPDLLMQIIKTWDQPRSTLQSFFEQHFGAFLPYSRSDGDLAAAVSTPLTYLEKNRAIDLFTMQDSPSKTYLGMRRLRGISLEM